MQAFQFQNLTVSDDFRQEMSRPSIPAALQHKLLYDSAWACVICQAKGCQIHHIDQDHSNNEESNLVLICVSHHDEAHNKRGLSKNLTSAGLRYAKEQWVQAVAENRKRSATVSGQHSSWGSTSGIGVGILWGYINHARVSEMADIGQLPPQLLRVLDESRSRGMVDDAGRLIQPQGWVPRDSPAANTIYKWFPYGDDQRIHALYSGMVDQVAATRRVVHLERGHWSPESVEHLIGVGDLVFTQTVFGFKTQDACSDNEHRRVRAKSSGLTVEFYVDTRNMRADSAINVSFKGRQAAAALLIVKSVNRSSCGEALLAATPLALGIGFQALRPAPARP